MIADANLRDDHTSAVLITYPKLYAPALAGQGWLGAAAKAAISGLQVDRVIDRFSEIYRDLFFKK